MSQKGEYFEFQTSNFSPKMFFKEVWCIDPDISRLKGKAVKFRIEEVVKQMVKKDKRIPKLKKVGVHYLKYKSTGFELFDDVEVKDNDVFIYNEGILWKLVE